MSDAVEHRFGRYGGQYVPETLMPALAELEAAWLQARADPAFGEELAGLLRDYAGRPTPLYRADRLSHAVGHDVYLKREDLLHTGAHKVNNALGQALLAVRMGKRRIIAETGAGQHGVATATACALLGLQCVVYMGTEDMRRQKPNVERMGLLGATVSPVEAGTGTLKEACSEAIRDWTANVAEHALHHRLLGGPRALPGAGARPPARDRRRGARPVPGTARATARPRHRLRGRRVQRHRHLHRLRARRGRGAGGRGSRRGRDRHRPPRRSAVGGGRAGVLHGSLSAVMQDADGQITEAHSISAGLDYPGSGPEHAHLRDSGRARYEAVTDEQALEAFQSLSQLEGIIPALESAHAIAWALENPDGSQLDLVCLSGRGDKDLAEALSRLG